MHWQRFAIFIEWGINATEWEECWRGDAPDQTMTKAFSKLWRQHMRWSNQNIKDKWNMRKINVVKICVRKMNFGKLLQSWKTDPEKISVECVKGVMQDCQKTFLGALNKCPDKLAEGRLEEKVDRRGGLSLRQFDCKQGKSTVDEHVQYCNVGQSDLQ